MEKQILEGAIVDFLVSIKGHQIEPKKKRKKERERERGNSDEEITLQKLFN